VIVRMILQWIEIASPGKWIDLNGMDCSVDFGSIINVEVVVIIV